MVDDDECFELFKAFAIFFVVCTVCPFPSTQHFWVVEHITPALTS